jgi:hypothetical protein
MLLAVIGLGGVDRLAPPAPAFGGSLPRATRLTGAKAALRGMSDDADSLIPYDEIVQEALRAGVGRCSAK